MPSSDYAQLPDEQLADLVARNHRDGNPKLRDLAFHELYVRHARSILAFVTARTQGNADDLSQLVWLQVIRGLKPGFTGSFRGWLFEVARNFVAESYRKRGRRRESAESDGLDPADNQQPSVLESLLEDERKQRLEECLHKLPEDLARLVRARLLGHDYDVLALEFKVTKDTAYRRLHLAKRHLQECVGDDLS